MMNNNVLQMPRSAYRTDVTPPVIAVDFDGCLCQSEWPGIGQPSTRVINALLKRQRDGCKVILWTCREDWMLAEAIGWCRAFGLYFDAVNANLPERIAQYGNDSRKINADEYWDDKSVRVADGSVIPK